MLGLMFSFACCLQAAEQVWKSLATGQEISYQAHYPEHPLKDARGRHMTIVYLTNLSCEKVGQNPIAEDVSAMLAEGYQILTLDYAKHEKAVAPYLNRDIVAINDALNRGEFCALKQCSDHRSYVLFEGYRLARDVAYYQDDPSVYNVSPQYVQGDSLYMDVAYPANPSRPVPVILSFSYSNSMPAKPHQRLFLGYTLAMFDDSFLQGAPAMGMAWAMADHPKYCDWGNGKPKGGANKAYGSFETNPDASRKVRSAVRVLRHHASRFGLNEKVALYGFSRGSTAASLAVGNKAVKDFDKAGLYQQEDARIQAALLGPGVFDYRAIYAAANDGDGALESRCPQVWGEYNKANAKHWEMMGATYTIRPKKAAPVLFFYNTTDEVYYQSQIANFQQLLREKRIFFDEIVDYGKGHSVPQDAASLMKMYRFCQKYLQP